MRLGSRHVLQMGRLKVLDFFEILVVQLEPYCVAVEGFFFEEGQRNTVLFDYLFLVLAFKPTFCHVSYYLNYQMFEPVVDGNEKILLEVILLILMPLYLSSFQHERV